MESSFTQLTFNDYQDRHPHLSHDGNFIIYTARYYCVVTLETRWVSTCSLPFRIDIVNPCGKKCEAMRVYDLAANSVIDVDHDMLTNANPEIWPERDSTDSRWVGHPSFNDDMTQILFSGAVDGAGRNWEVYLADWDGSTVTGLRQITKGSDYGPNPNPIKMSAGAHFSEVDNTIIFGSTRTPYGNSLIYEVPISNDRVPISSAYLLQASIDKANYYVPEPLSDGRIVVTSDQEEFDGFNPCIDFFEYSAILDGDSSHIIRIEATNQADPLSQGTAIHLDAYEYGLVFGQEDNGTTYSGNWTITTSPNASMGNYAITPGDSGQYVDIAVPAGNIAITLYLGRTPLSGIARIYVDGNPISDGDTLLDFSGLNLYTEFMSVGNDLDLILFDSTGQTNLTDNDYADDMLLMGDEVSWFCGLSPNLSLCTYLPKYFKKKQLCWMMNSEIYLPDYYPARDLYPIAYSALDDYMSSPNPLRPHNQEYWADLQFNLCDSLSGDDLVVLPTPLVYFIENEAPTSCTSIYPAPNDTISGLIATTITFIATSSSDPNGDPVHYDINLSSENEPMITIAADIPAPEVTVPGMDTGAYSWQVISKDSRGGITDSPIWNFWIVSSPGCDYPVGDVNGSDSYNGLDITYGVAYFKGGPDPLCDLCPLPSCDAFHYCGDVNSSCSYNGLDITYGVSFFKGGASPIPCLDCPPGGGPASSGDNEIKPAVQPANEFNPATQPSPDPKSKSKKGAATIR